MNDFAGSLCEMGRRMVSRVVYPLLVLAALGGLAACTTSSSTSSTKVRTSSPSARAESATEVIEASTANPDATSVAVKASGVFADTGTLKLPIEVFSATFS